MAPPPLGPPLDPASLWRGGVPAEINTRMIGAAGAEVHQKQSTSSFLPANQQQHPSSTTAAVHLPNQDHSHHPHPHPPCFGLPGATSTPPVAAPLLVPAGHLTSTLMSARATENLSAPADTVSGTIAGFGMASAAGIRLPSPPLSGRMQAPPSDATRLGGFLPGGGVGGPADSSSSPPGAAVAKIMEGAAGTPPGAAASDSVRLQALTKLREKGSSAGRTAANASSSHEAPGPAKLFARIGLPPSDISRSTSSGSSSSVVSASSVGGSGSGSLMPSPPPPALDGQRQHQRRPSLGGRSVRPAVALQGGGGAMRDLLAVQQRVETSEACEDL